MIFVCGWIFIADVYCCRNEVLNEEVLKAVIWLAARETQTRLHMAAWFTADERTTPFDVRITQGQAGVEGTEQIAKLVCFTIGSPLKKY